MKQKQLERWAYAKPEVEACPMQIESLLDSLSGQHHDAQPGGSFDNAKQGWLDEEEEEDF